MQKKKISINTIASAIWLLFQSISTIVLYNWFLSFETGFMSVHMLAFCHVYFT
jgi:hypothetical protein